MRIGSATSAGLKGFSSDSPKNSAERNTKTMTKTDQSQRARLAKGPLCDGTRNVITLREAGPIIRRFVESGLLHPAGRPTSEWAYQARPIHTHGQPGP